MKGRGVNVLGVVAVSRPGGRGGKGGVKNSVNRDLPYLALVRAGS